MVRTKRLRSVIHSIAHHGVSGLCHLHPHLGKARKVRNLDRYQLSLLPSQELSELEKNVNEIRLSAGALREQFMRIIEAEDLSLNDLSKACITYCFIRDSWPSGCHVFVETNMGKEIEVGIDSIGNPAEILKF